jgi:hypothetical protein
MRFLSWLLLYAAIAVFAYVLFYYFFLVPAPGPNPPPCVPSYYRPCP